VNAQTGARVGNRQKSLSCSHSSHTPSSGKPSKQLLSTQAGGFGEPCGLLTLLGACHSGEGGLITRWGLGLDLCLGVVNRRPRLAKFTVGHCRLTSSLYRGASSYEVPATTTTPTYGASPFVDICRRPSGSLDCRLLA